MSSKISNTKAFTLIELLIAVAIASIIAIALAMAVSQTSAYLTLINRYLAKLTNRIYLQSVFNYDMAHVMPIQYDKPANIHVYHNQLDVIAFYRDFTQINYVLTNHQLFRYVYSFPQHHLLAKQQLLTNIQKITWQTYPHKHIIKFWVETKYQAIEIWSRYG